MDKTSRRTAARDFRERKVTPGVFSLRCTQTGEVWVGPHRNLDQKNGLMFTLKMGSHPNRDLQAAWRDHGEAGFAYELLETLEDETLGDLGRAEWLKAAERRWRETLQARPII